MEAVATKEIHVSKGVKRAARREKIPFGPPASVIRF